jgi:hypothetical protein
VDTTPGTIRKNARKRIRALLESAVLIIRYQDTDMDCKDGPVTADEVMMCADRFGPVRLDERGILHIIIHNNHSYDAYPTVEAARAVLTAFALAKYLPQQRPIVTATEIDPASS